ncbi:MAG: hypothetical protein ACE5JL_13410 [Dehalococcoidia bacterium]
MNEREIIRRCTETNLAYMRLPAGQADYRELVRVYRRIASQSLECARAWEEERPCPRHEAAVDAFWHGVASWAREFAADVTWWWIIQAGTKNAQEVQALVQEFHEVFVLPHIRFAHWLKPARPSLALGDSRLVNAPARIILDRDASWTWSVMWLSVRWGFLDLLRELQAVWQGLALIRKLRAYPNPVALAYLESDLVFFNELFQHFPLQQKPRVALHKFLGAAAADLQGQQAKIPQEAGFGSL